MSVRAKLEDGPKWLSRLRAGEPSAEAWLAGVVQSTCSRWLSRERTRRHLGLLDQTSDLVQEVCLKLVRRVRGRPAALRETRADLRRLIVWSAKEVLRDKERSMRGPGGWGRALFEATEQLDARSLDETSVASRAQGRERAARLNAALDRLSADERTAIEAVFLQGRSYREAAQALGCGLGALRGRVVAAFEKLRPALAPLDSSFRETEHGDDARPQ